MYFGHPCFRGSGDNITFDIGQTDMVKNITLEPFVIKRMYHKLRDETYDIVQNFVLYHNLFFDHSKRAYYDILKEEKIVEYVSSKHIRVREEYLRDYLAARKMALVRYHDHRRYRDVSVLEIFGRERKEVCNVDPNHHYEIVIGQYGMNGEAFSRLVGKDIILPYQEPKHEDYAVLAGKSKVYEKYVYGIDSVGNRMEETCDQESDEPRGNFLTHIFFKKEVLQKYYAKPTFYKIEDGEIYCLDLWSIPFSKNSDDLIHVWLGDLGRIPHDEQLHWKQYNTPPRNGTNVNFIHRQLLGKFTEKDDICEILLDLKSSINAAFAEKFNFKLFRDMPPNNQHNIDNLHIPTTNEEKEFDEQILNLVMNFIEVINKSDLDDNVAEPPSNSGSLNSLDNFLSKRAHLDQHDHQTILKPFKLIQRLRSESLHLRGKNYDKTILNFGLDDLGPIERFEKVVREFRMGLEHLHKLLTC